MCSGKDTFLKCEKILKDYKSEQNPCKVANFAKTCKVASSTCRKMTPLQIFFNWFI